MSSSGLEVVGLVCIWYTTSCFALTLRLSLFIVVAQKVLRRTGRDQIHECLLEFTLWKCCSIQAITTSKLCVTAP